MLNCGFGCCEAGNGHGFRFQGSRTNVDEGDAMDSPHIVFGTVKISPNFRVGPKMSMCYLHKICLK